MKNRKGFASLDLILTMVLLSILLGGFYEIKKAQKIEQTHIDELRTLQSLDTGMIASFDDIIAAYGAAISVTDTSTQWGWNTNNSVSPFPTTTTVSGTVYLMYNLSATNLGATQLAALKSRIAANYTGSCQDWTSRVSATTANLYLRCEDVVSLRYSLSNGTTGLARAHTLGQPIDPGLIPTAAITFAQKDGAGNFYRNQIYTVSFSQAFEKRRVFSANKLAQMRSAMENFVNATKLKEIANPENANQSGGLNNADDEFVGWHWKAFGDNRTSILNTYCIKAVGGGNCSNLNTSSIWRSGTNIRRGLIVRRFVTNLMDSDTSYYVDAFGNGIYIYPTALQCAGTSYSACSINSLRLPADNYIANTSPNTPPYATIFYTDPYTLKATAGEEYGRVIAAY